MTTSSKSDSIFSKLFLWGLLVAVGLFVYPTLSDIWDESVTVFIEIDKTPTPESPCQNGSNCVINVHSESYKINKFTDSVVKKDNQSNSINILKDCAIWNISNWRCKIDSPDPFGEHTMLNGSFRDYTYGNMQVKHISRLSYFFSWLDRPNKGKDD